MTHFTLRYHTMQLNYKLFGNPWHEPLVILHGMFGTLDNWQTVAKTLAERYCIYALDLRNHGRSPHSDQFSYPIMAQDVAEFLDQQALREAHIIGHSMGGKVAMQLAFTQPNLVQSLTVVDIAPKTYTGHHDEVFTAMFAINPDQIQSRQEAEAILKTQPLDWSTQQFILKNLIYDKDTQHYQWRMNLPVIYKHYAEILDFQAPTHKFDAPTLFLRGEKSNYIPLQEFDSLTQPLFSNVQLQTIPNAGHWVHADNPNDFCQAIFDFI